MIDIINFSYFYKKLKVYCWIIFIITNIHHIHNHILQKMIENKFKLFLIEIFC